MKKVIPLLLTVLFYFNSFSQVDTTRKISKKQVPDLYLGKSKSQKTTAWIMLGGGTVMTVVGTLIWLNAIRKEEERDPLVSALTLGLEPASNANQTGLYISAAGIVSTLTSIPLFIASGKNKHKAATLSFGKQHLLQLSNKNIVTIPVPAIQLSLKF